jgi:hypothetical protein
MARFKFGRPISLRWNGLLIEGPAETTFEIPDEYYEEFNEDIGPVEPTLVWLDADEGSTLRARVTALELASGSFAILDAKGDLISATADNVAARLGVGTDGQVLVANSATSTGLQWQENVSVSTTKVKEYVKNNSGVTINKGQAVYVSGADGTNVLVGLADYDTDETSSKTLGLMETTVANNGFGYVITQGILTGFDTTAASAAGVPVWLGEDGNLVYGTAPSEPAHTVYIGVVTRRNVSNGEVFIKVQNGYELTELHDVEAASPADNDIIQYNSTSGTWKNETLANAGISATGHTHSQSDVTSLTTTLAGKSDTSHTHSQYLADSGDTLTGTLTVSTTGAIRVYGATSTSTTQLTTSVDGDVSNRWGARADGFQSWGDGTNARDTNLYRSAANILKTDDSFDVGLDLTVGGDITGGNVTITGDVIHASQLDFIAGGAVGASVISSGLYLPPSKVVRFEGATSDSFETDLTVVDPTADRTITFPDATGTVALTSQLMPTGSVVMWMTATAPTGWLFLDGSTISQSAYPALAAVFGVGSGTFALPDMRDRFAAGRSDTALGWANSSGTFGPNAANSIAHTHTTDIAHGHADTIAVSTHGDHTHSVNPAATTSGTNSASFGAASGINAVASNGHTHSTDIAATTSAAESTNLTHTVTGGVTSLGATSVTSSAMSANGTVAAKSTLVNFIIKT